MPGKKRPNKSSEKSALRYNSANRLKMMTGAPLFRFKQGDHCCVFYEDENALLDLLIPFFAEGLQKRERCFAAQSDRVAARLIAGLKKTGIDADREIARGALTIATLSQFYGNDARNFDPDTLMASLTAFVAESIRRGYSGSRTAGEMQFAIDNHVELNQLLKYEGLVDAAFPTQPVLGICQYNTRLFSPETLRQAIDVHRQCMSDVQPSARHSSMAIRSGRYVLDIVTDRNNPEKNFYYVAQEHGKNEILGWGVEPNFDEAISQGETLLRALQL